MSDRLSSLLQQVAALDTARVIDDPDERVRVALERALEATTPEHPGAPWDNLESDRDEEPQRGIWIPEND